MNVHKLNSTFVVVDEAYRAETVAVTDEVWVEIEARYGDFARRTLISGFEFDEPWPTWEVHPHGDEIVCLLEGDVEMTLALPDGDETRRMSVPGEFLIVPRGVWHTANPRCPTRMLFITPGQDTENREQPPRPGS